MSDLSKMSVDELLSVLDTALNHWSVAVGRDAMAELARRLRAETFRRAALQAENRLLRHGISHMRADIAASLASSVAAKQQYGTGQASRHYLTGCEDADRTWLAAVDAILAAAPAPEPEPSAPQPAAPPAQFTRVTTYEPTEEQKQGAAMAAGIKLPDKVTTYQPAPPPAGQDDKLREWPDILRRMAEGLAPEYAATCHELADLLASPSPRCSRCNDHGYEMVGDMGAVVACVCKAWPPMSTGMRKREPERNGIAWLAWYCGMVHDYAHWVPAGDGRLACEIAQRLASPSPEPAAATQARVEEQQP